MAVITGTTGNDELVGTPGDDVLRGLAGNDTLEGLDGFDDYRGGPGDDTFNISLPGETAKGIEIYDGGTGYDTIDCTISTLSGFADFALAVFDDIEAFNVAGSAWMRFDQVQSLQSISATIISLYGFGQLNFTAKTYAVFSIGIGYDGPSRLVLTGQTALPDYIVTCHGFDDVVFGPDSASLIMGFEGSDILRGGLGGDQIEGGRGGDRLSGGGGDDILIGGRGTDALAGGMGADRFRFESLADSWPGSARDFIVDFEPGADLIDLSGVAASIKTTLFLQATPGEPFSGTAGEIRTYENIGGTRTLIALDADGDGAADFSISLDGLHALTEADFIL